MSGPLFLLVFVCLFSASMAFSQGSFSVDESKLTAVFKDKWLTVDIPVRSVRRVENVNARLEVIDQYDTLVAKSDTAHAINPGSQRLTIPVSGLLVKADKLLLYRLRYSLSQPDSPNTFSSTVALSEITPEIFELQITAPENVYAGMNIRAHVVAVHPLTKRPIRNVDVSGTVELDLITDDDEDELKLTASATTNAAGVATLEFKIPANAKLDDDGDLDIEGRKNGIVRTAYSDLDAGRGAFVHLNTDKPIYQPG